MRKREETVRKNETSIKSQTTKESKENKRGKYIQSVIKNKKALLIMLVLVLVVFAILIASNQEIRNNVIQALSGEMQNAEENETISKDTKLVEIEDKGYEYTVDNFIQMPNISIDYAVAEKSQKMMMMPMQDIYWNDIGSFDAIAEVLSDENNNAFLGDTLTDNCTNTMIIAEDRLVAGIDLNNLVIVDTPDALLVAQKGQSQKVKDVVSKLKKADRKEARENLTMYRSWGKYTLLTEGKDYRVRKVEMNPGKSLMMQMHYHRSEHWTVISGTGKITIDDKESIFTENQSTYIPMGVKHKLSNPGKIPLVIIEVQSGKYINDDDIVVLE